jgi:hypothetical protein
LRGLAQYAQTHATAYRRIEAVAEVNGKLRVLDLTRADVRAAIDTLQGGDVTAQSLFAGTLAKDYL